MGQTDHDPAKARFLTIQAVRLSGVVTAVLGALRLVQADDVVTLLGATRLEVLALVDVGDRVVALDHFYTPTKQTRTKQSSDATVHDKKTSRQGILAPVTSIHTSQRASNGRSLSHGDNR